MRLILCVFVAVILVIGLTGISGCVEEKEITKQVSDVQAPLENQGNPSNTKQTPTTTKTPTATTTKTTKPTSTPQPNGPFIYSTQSTSKVYHYPWCSYVAQIKHENKGTFSSSTEARAAGYHPCSRCNPP